VFDRLAIVSGPAAALAAVLASALVATLTIGAAVVPAWRAAHIDPAAALRQE
jgi:ABC-type lipoprotein release transport system permease subunit